MPRTINEEVKEKEHPEGLGDLPSIVDGKLSTGSTSLDKRTNGLPQGSIIAIIGDTTPASLLNFHLSLTLRNTHYVTISRRKSILEQQLKSIAKRNGIPEEECDKRMKIIEEYAETSLESIAQEIQLTAGRLKEYENLIIDSFSLLGQISESEYYRLLRDVKRKTHEKNALTYLYMPVSYDDLTRQELEGLHIADGVATVTQETSTSGSVEFYMKFMKLRDDGEDMIDTELQLTFGHDGVDIDASGVLSR